MIKVGKLTVVSTRPLDDESRRMVKAVSPGIELWDASDLETAEQRGDFTSREKYDAMLSHAEVIYTAVPPRDVLHRAPGLKWLHARRAGVDYALYADIFQSPVMVTNGRGSHGIQVSELVLNMMLMLAKQSPRSLRWQQEAKWQWFTPTLLHSRTVGIVGLGSIGKEVARLASAFRMKVIASRRSVTEVTHTRYVERVLPKDRLPELLSASDFVVLALPATPETFQLIGEKEFRSMKPTAYFINIARGSIVDEAALIRALDEHWIAGAGLDAFTTEPLPPDSKLWKYPNVICTSHIAGASESGSIAGTRLFCENLRRYLGGRKLLNVVDKKAGY